MRPILEGVDHESAIETILVVDDSSVVRRVLRETLEAEGWRVREAEDGVDAWQQIVAARPDLVVTDLGMPRLDGQGLIRRMKEHRVSAAIPILMLTAQDGEGEAGGADYGADDYVSKSADTERVLARIRRLLRRGRARDRAA